MQETCCIYSHILMLHSHRHGVTSCSRLQIQLLVTWVICSYYCIIYAWISIIPIIIQLTCDRHLAYIQTYLNSNCKHYHGDYLSQSFRHLFGFNLVILAVEVYGHYAHELEHYPSYNLANDSHRFYLSFSKLCICFI